MPQRKIRAMEGAKGRQLSRQRMCADYHHEDGAERLPKRFYGSDECAGQSDAQTDLAQNTTRLPACDIATVAG